MHAQEAVDNLYIQRYKARPGGRLVSVSRLVAVGIEVCGRTPSRATHAAVDGALDSRETRLPVPQGGRVTRSRVRVPEFPKIDPKRRWPPFRPKGKGRRMSSNLASGHLMRWVDTSRSRFSKIFNFGPVGPRGRDCDLGRWEGVSRGVTERLPGRLMRS